MLLCHQQLHKWRNKLQLFLSCHIPRCYNHKDVKVVSMQLHCLSDSSQLAYAGVVYLRMIDEQGNIHTSMVISETKVAPVIRSTIPSCMELVQPVYHNHCKVVFGVPPDQIFPWTDSMIGSSAVHASSRPLLERECRRSQSSSHPSMEA